MISFSMNCIFQISIVEKINLYVQKSVARQLLFRAVQIDEHDCVGDFKQKSLHESLETMFALVNRACHVMLRRNIRVPLLADNFLIK